MRRKRILNGSCLGSFVILNEGKESPSPMIAHVTISLVACLFISDFVLLWSAVCYLICQRCSTGIFQSKHLECPIKGVICGVAMGYLFLWLDHICWGSKWKDIYPYITSLTFMNIENAGPFISSSFRDCSIFEERLS